MKLSTVLLGSPVGLTSGGRGTRPWLPVLLSVLGLFFALCIVLLPAAEAKGIHATVEASWTETSLFQEGCEWASHALGAEGFYACLEAVRAAGASPADDGAGTNWAAAGGGARAASPAAQYRILVSHVVNAWCEGNHSVGVSSEGLQVSPGQQALFELEMASRVFSPAVEVHYSLAERAIAAAAGTEAGSTSSTLASICAGGAPFVAFAADDGSVRVVNDVDSLEAALPLLGNSRAEWENTDAIASGLGFNEELDHAHPLSAADVGSSPMGARPAVVVLYGLIGEPTSMDLYDAVVRFLQSNADSARVAFVFRHLPVNPARLCQATTMAVGFESPAWTTRPLYVQGYGATVDLKNMEYKVVDEKKQQGKTKDEEDDDGSAAVMHSGEAGEVGGFDIRRLKERHPALTVQLDSFAGAMEDELGKAETKVDLDGVEAQNIALAAALQVHEAKAEEKLAVLSEVVSRFPMYAARLAKLATRMSRLAPIQAALEKRLFRSAGGKAMLFVDGVQVPDRDLSLFGVLQRLRSEEAFLDSIRRLLTLRPPLAEATGAGRAVAPRLVPLTAPGAEAEIEETVRSTQKLLRQYTEENPFMPPRIRIPRSTFMWLNDLETSPLFDGLPKSMSVATQVAPGGRRLMPRRNLVHLMVVLHPSSPANAPLLSQLFSVANQGVFVRIGVAFLDPEWTESVAAGGGGDGDWQAGDAERRQGEAPPSAASLLARTLTALFVTALKDGDASTLPVLLQGIAYMAHQRIELTAEGLYEMAASMHLIDSEELSLADLLSDRESQSFFHDQQASLRRLGLADPSLSLPMSFVNGVRVPSGRSVRAALDQVMDENEYVRSLILRKVLTDKTTDPYDTILARARCADHYQSALDPANMLHFRFDTVALADFLHVQPFVYPVDNASLSAWNAKRGEAAKAPLALTSVTSTSVLLIPSRLSLEHAAQVLASTLEAHQAPPLPMLTSKQQSQRYQKETKAAKAKAPKAFTEIVQGGAARLTVVFPDAETGPAASPPAGHSVQQTIELLLQYDAAATRATGRLSTAVADYVSWMQSALAAEVQNASTRLGYLRVDDPSSEAALSSAAPMPASVSATVEAVWHAAAGDERWAYTAKQKEALAHMKNAIKKQLVLAHFMDAAGRRPVLEVAVLLINGRAVVMRAPATVTTADVRSALGMAAGPASITVQQLEKLNFAQLSADGSGFQPEALDGDFFASKAAAFQSLLVGHEERQWVSAAGRAVGVPEPRLEGEVLPPLEEAGPLAFTLPPAGSAGRERKAGGEGSGADSAEPPARHRISLLVDPAARESQLVVALGEFFHKSPLGVRLTVYMNPSLQVTRPIRDLFTFVASPVLRFDEKTDSVVPPAAVFRALPTQALLTLGIEEPASWTVFSHEAEADLDNIILAKLPKHRQFVSAAYKIQSLIVAGSVLKLAADGVHAEFANGLPLTLRPLMMGTAADATAFKPAAGSTDTLVMQTVGYYQLQASAGLFQVSVKPGPFAAAYYIAGFGDNTYMFSADYGANAAGDLAKPFNVSAGQRLPLLISTFAGLSLDMFVRAVPSSGGQPDIMAIAETEAARTKRVWPPTESGTKPAKPTLNIFSVASGHLYERFLRMMMYSVFTASSDKHGRNTTRIKFWVIENFLSPQFKAYIPLMAEHFGFEVGFVTYRWPWWLQRQTEKQRKIWAYKILFLDVLFPLDVDRVIFVDADQTDRADLHDLYNMDIDDSPVAMTPFCEKHKNEATTGFRFWTQGFWTRHLAGRPYHISAIFLIDLHRFRAMGAGDIYRSTYSQLVTDPNSLANLDQDLPNYVQRSVPIFSLPEEWLWCETWCDAESKATAKTIDLCNNPLTKMPKLDNAKMIVPNWEETDDMLESLAAKLSAEKEAAGTTTTAAPAPSVPTE